jgi:putative membrane protein
MFDQTAMSWIRTAISLITFGFTIYKFFQIELEQSGVHVARRQFFGARGFALMLVGAGLLSLIVGSVEHRKNIQPLIIENPGMPRSRIGLLALLVGIVGILAFVTAILRQ